MNKVVEDAIEIPRCSWCSGDALYESYHDSEWGVPVKDDRTLYEKICLEGFQAGLSWITILRKRYNFRKSFNNFDFYKVCDYDQRRVESLLKNSNIVRHRGKIESTINNANRAKDLVDEAGSLANFFWSFEPNQIGAFSKNESKNKTSPLAYTAESSALSKALKKRGWTFVGPTICYSFMQAMGLVNDHSVNCFRKSRIDGLRSAFRRPNPPTLD